MHFRSLLATSWLSILFLCVTAAPIDRTQAQLFNLDHHLSPRGVHPGILHHFANLAKKNLLHTPKHVPHKPVETHELKAAYREAMRHTRKMEGMPGKDEKYTYKDQTYSGRDIRTAAVHVFMLNKFKKQVGLNKHSKYPHQFQNHPYHETHPDPTLAGKHPIPVSHTDMPKMQLYPLMPGKAFSGSEKPGSTRVVVSDNKFHAVLTHDSDRSDKKGDHYVVPKTKSG